MTGPRRWPSRPEAAPEHLKTCASLPRFHRIDAGGSAAVPSFPALSVSWKRSRRYTTAYLLMIDTYRIPVLTLLCLLVAVFGTLYARVRTIRSLLWLLGWTAAALQLIFLQLSSHPYGVFPGLSEASIQVAALMFLGSLSPLKLRHNNVRYITLFAVPLIFFSFFALLSPSPDMLLRILMLLSELAAVSVAVAWSLRENLLPPWFTTLFALSVGGFCLYAGIHNQYEIVLDAALAGDTFITALLILSAYRRWTAGVVFT